MYEQSCIVCGRVATQYFDGHEAYPVCGSHKCEQELLDEINEQLREVIAEVTEEK